MGVWGGGCGEVAALWASEGWGMPYERGGGGEWGCGSPGIMGPGLGSALWMWVGTVGMEAARGTGCWGWVVGALWGWGSGAWVGGSPVGMAWGHGAGAVGHPEGTEGGGGAAGQGLGVAAHHGGHSTEVGAQCVPRFATKERDALLLYNGRFNEKHDFVALEIVQEQIQLTFSAGRAAPWHGIHGISPGRRSLALHPHPWHCIPCFPCFTSLASAGAASPSHALCSWPSVASISSQALHPIPRVPSHGSVPPVSPFPVLPPP